MMQLNGVIYRLMTVPRCKDFSAIPAYSGNRCKKPRCAAIDNKRCLYRMIQLRRK